MQEKMFSTFARKLPRQSSSVFMWSNLMRSTSTYREFSQSCIILSSKLSQIWSSENFQLLDIEDKAGLNEDTLFNQQVQNVKEWWASPRYEGIKRPYSPEDVVSKRGSLQQTYPSSMMARKLFELLRTRAASGQPVHTSVSSQTDSL